MKENATKDKLASYMGFASRARKILSGTNTCIFTIEKKKGKLLIISRDMAENSRDKLISKAKTYGVDYRIFGESDELSHWTGMYGSSAFLVTDDNFAKVIRESIDGIGPDGNI